MRIKILYGLILLALLSFGCEKYKSPSVTVLTPTITDVEINTSIDIGFEIKTDAGYHSSILSAEKGAVINKTDIGQGAVQGVIYVSYTANTESGNDSINFTVIDEQVNQASIKIKINVIDND